MDTTPKKLKLKYHLNLDEDNEMNESNKDEDNEMNESNKDENDQIVVVIKQFPQKQKKF